MPLKPGSCTLRLQHVHTLSSSAKRSLLQAIADDITATLITVAQHATAGHLHHTHTEPVHAVIALIKDTAQNHRRALERTVLRYRRRLRQSRREQRWMRRHIRQLVGKLAGWQHSQHSQLWPQHPGKRPTQPKNGIHSIHMRGECSRWN